MTIRTASSFEIARLIDLQPTDESQFYLLIDSRDGESVLEDLNAELEMEGRESPDVLEAETLSVEALLKELDSSASSIVVVRGLEDWTNEQFTQLDVNRSRLEVGRVVILLLDAVSAGRLLNCAPNLRSYVGTSIFSLGGDTSLMTSQEVSHRLEQLRSYYKMSDDDVIEGASNNSLPLEPQIAEWLVLLGRSELVG